MTTDVISVKVDVIQHGKALAGYPTHLLKIGATGMDKSQFMQLLNINWELSEICKSLKENKNTGLESRMVPITGWGMTPTTLMLTL